MFDTLMASTLAYDRAHPDELAHYGANQTPAEGIALARRYVAWELTTPPWNTPTLQRRLRQERTQFQRVSQAERTRFSTAKHAAIVQLRLGEHA